MSNSIKDSAQAFAVNQVLKYVDSNPQEAFPKLLDWADKFDKDNLYLTQRQQIRKVMEQPDSNWMRLINSLWTDIDSEVRKVFFRNFIVQCFGSFKVKFRQRFNAFNAGFQKFCGFRFPRRW